MLDVTAVGSAPYAVTRDGSAVSSHTRLDTAIERAAVEARDYPAADVRIAAGFRVGWEGEVAPPTTVEHVITPSVLYREGMAQLGIFRSGDTEMSQVDWGNSITLDAIGQYVLLCTYFTDEGGTIVARSGSVMEAKSIDANVVAFTVRYDVIPPGADLPVMPDVMIDWGVVQEGDTSDPVAADA